MSKVNPKIDLVFKKLFGSEENKDILISLVNAILPEDEPVVEITLKNPYNVSDYKDGKLSILDIKAEDEKGYLYDIEMQIKGSHFYGKRTLYYWAKIFGSQLDGVALDQFPLDEEMEKKKRKTYSDLNKCIVISLMDFEFFKDEKYHRCFMLKDRDSNVIHPDLDYLDLYFVELEKFENKYKTVKTVLDRWITFLNHAGAYSKDTLPKELAEIDSIRKASERLEVMHFNDKEREVYEAQQKKYLDELSRLQEAIEEAVEEAVGDAKQEEKIIIAKKMILAGSNNEFVSQMTDLTIEQIEQLRKETK